MSKATKEATVKATALTTAKSDKAIDRNLTKEEVAKAQETAQDKILAFDESLAKQLAKDYQTTCNHKNEITLKRDSISFKMCYKHNKIAVYSNTASNEMRNKMLKVFKYTENITKASNEKYLASKTNKEFQVTITHNTVDKELIEIIDTLFTNLKEARTEVNKQTKKAK